MFVSQKFLRTILTIVCAVSLPVSAAWAASSVQVTVDKLNVRSGPSLQDRVIITLPNKTVLPVVAAQNDWIKVQLPNGTSGWVAKSYVTSQKAQAPAPASQIESSTDNLNVRSGPGQTYPAIQTINPGTRYTIVQKSGQWVQIQLSAQTKGWVASWLVTEKTGGQQSGGGSSSGTGTAATGGTPSPAKPSAVQGASLTLEYAPYVYAAPNAQTPAIGQLHAGETITVLTQQSGWIQFPYQGVNAWISTANAAPTNPPATNSGTDRPEAEPDLPDVDPANPIGIDSPPSPAGQSPSAQQTATVQTDGLNLRSEANTTSSILATLATGSSLTILEKQGEWYRVQTPNGKTGWVAGWLINVSQPSVPTPTGPYVTIINPDTNVRSGPGTQHGIVKRVQTGEKYAIANKSGEWFQLTFSDGSTGYVAGWLVSASGVPAVVRGNELVNKLIVVDAGHGGNDNGATGSSFSTVEKTVNLQVSLLLRNKLEASGAKVIMTRGDDRKLTLQQRVDVAVLNKADIFISIHHNTHLNTATNGTIVFYYNKGNSSKLASLVQNEIVKATTYKDLQSRYGNYFVLRENPVTSILAEIGFLSNYNEEIRVRSEKQQDLAAEGLYKGIIQYFASQNTQGG